MKWRVYNLKLYENRGIIAEIRNAERNKYQISNEAGGHFNCQVGIYKYNLAAEGDVAFEGRPCM